MGCLVVPKIASRASLSSSKYFGQIVAIPFRLLQQWGALREARSPNAISLSRQNASELVSSHHPLGTLVRGSNRYKGRCSTRNADPSLASSDVSATPKTPRPRSRRLGWRANKPSSVLSLVTKTRARIIHLGPLLPTTSSAVTRELWAGRPQTLPYSDLHRVGFTMRPLSPEAR